MPGVPVWRPGVPVGGHGATGGRGVPVGGRRRPRRPWERPGVPWRYRRPWRPFYRGGRAAIKSHWGVTQDPPYFRLKCQSAGCATPWPREVPSRLQTAAAKCEFGRTRKEALPGMAAGRPSGRPGSRTSGCSPKTLRLRWSFEEKIGEALRAATEPRSEPPPSNRAAKLSHSLQLSPTAVVGSTGESNRGVRGARRARQAGKSVTRCALPLPPSSGLPRRHRLISIPPGGAPGRSTSGRSVTSRLAPL